MSDEPAYDIEVTRLLDAPPAAVYRAFIDAGEFARWYGPPGFPVRQDSVEVDARINGVHRFTMVSEADPAMRTGFTGRFTEVIPGVVLASSGTWDGIPGVDGPWPSNLRVEFHAEGDKTRLVLREGPHPPGTAELGRQAWDVMLPKLAAIVA